MWVIDVINAPPALRGKLSRWAVEVRAGLYVGSCDVKQRDAIWAWVTTMCRKETCAVLVYPSRSAQGFEALTHGEHRREVVDVDGMLLAKFHPDDEKSIEETRHSILFAGMSEAEIWNLEENDIDFEELG